MPSRPIILLLLAGLLPGLLAGCRDGPERDRGAEPTTAPPAGTAGSEGGPAFAVGVRNLTFVDASRPTDPGERRGRNATEAPTRTLPTTIWYPASAPAESRTAAVPDAPPAPGGPFPIVVFSHGLGGFPAAYAGLVTRWAAAGFVVAAPTYPLTSVGASWDEADDVRHQPADASFVLSALLDQGSEPGDAFAGVLDAGRVAAAGHSLGGITTIGLFNRCCRDERLDAGIVLAGSDIGFGGDGAFSGLPAPVLFVHGDDDRVVAYRAGENAYAAARTWPKALVTLVGGDHVSPFLGGEQPAAAVVNGVTTAFLRWALGGDATAPDDLRDAVSDAGPDVATIDDELGGA